MKQIFMVFTITTLLSSCNGDELEKLKQENIALSDELSSLKTSFLAQEAKKEFFGEYINQERGLYKSFDFKGESSVTLTDGIIGFPYATSYDRDGDVIRVRTDKSDLMLVIKDGNTLIGEGFAGGTYIKRKSSSSTDNKLNEADTSIHIPEDVKFYYTLKDKKTGVSIEVSKFPDNWEQKYEYVSNRTEIVKNGINSRVEQNKNN